VTVELKEGRVIESCATDTHGRTAPRLTASSPSEADARAAGPACRRVLRPSPKGSCYTGGATDPLASYPHANDYRPLASSCPFDVARLGDLHRAVFRSGRCRMGEILLGAGFRGRLGVVGTEQPRLWRGRLAPVYVGDVLRDHRPRDRRREGARNARPEFGAVVVLAARPSNRRRADATRRSPRRMDRERLLENGYSRLMSFKSRIYVRGTVAERFWAHVIQTDSGCWEWTGSRARKGYGRLGVPHGTPSLAHRISWEIHFGPIPDGLCVLHHCDNPPCSNPAHLWIGSKADNNRDMRAKGRSRITHHRGESHPRAKLTRTDVDAIRLSYVPWRTTRKSLAKQYGVSESAIKAILSGRNWA